MKRLVLIGGGHSHVEVIRRIGMRPSPGLHVTLVSPQRHTPYSGMLPGLVAGHYDYAECHIDLQALCAAACVDWVADAAAGLDLPRRTCTLQSGAGIGYDIVSLDIGSAPPPDRQAPRPGREIGIKPTETFLGWWDDLRVRARVRPLRLLVVGGGAGGIEMTLAMQHRLQSEGARATFSIATMERSILAGHPPGVRRRFARVLQARGIGVLTGARVTHLDAGGAWLDSGAQLEADGVVWALGPVAAQWPGRAGLATNERGFVLVDRHLRSISHPEVFAAGDIATMRERAHPKSGVYAVRHGPPLAENLRRTLAGEKLVTYSPQRVALALISTGERCAVASWGPLSLHGAWVWRWKDRIDRGFMARYRARPAPS
ncbi:MAG: FAD-dependent oxidoreductase [Burkholderiales bacterium]|nr:FAD-dependent oxidoreductase [Burkholderiales bacterium]